MRLPRDLSGADLVKRLERLGYAVTRQTGSHMRLSSQISGEHPSPFPITTRYASVRWDRYWRALARIMVCRGMSCSIVCLTKLQKTLADNAI
jgi:hypothetical protein